MATVTRYVNCSVASSGDGTTNGEGSGGVNAWASLAAAYTGLVAAYAGGILTDNVIVECSSGSSNVADTSQPVFSGITTALLTQLLIRPKTGEEAKSSGFLTNRYRLDGTGYDSALKFSGNATHVTVQNLQVRHTRSAGDTNMGINFTAINFIVGRVSAVMGCRVELVHSGSAVNSRGVNFDGSGAGWINNTIVKGSATTAADTGAHGIFEGFDGSLVYAYNCIVDGFGIGYRSLGTQLLAKNSIAINCLDPWYGSSLNASSDYNAGTVETPPGAHSVLGSPAFSAGYTLSPSDTVARNAAVTLTGDAGWLLADVDIDAIVRPQGASWDIGPSEAVAAAGGTNVVHRAGRRFSRAGHGGGRAGY